MASSKLRLYRMPAMHRSLSFARGRSEHDHGELSTEEEGVALLGGAWLGGQRGVLLMQSSGVGNCINMLSLSSMCQFPLLMLITMRGDHGEFNAAQIPMGQATQTVLEAMGVIVKRADSADEVIDAVEGAMKLAYNGYRATAVLLGQKLLGAKDFRKLAQVE
jgi:sulfopyruvate decarboxylase alpha subunit